MEAKNSVSVDEEGTGDKVSEEEIEKITLKEAVNMTQKLRCFIISKKDVLDWVLESCEILQKHAEKVIMQQPTQENYRFLYYIG